MSSRVARVSDDLLWVMRSPNLLQGSNVVSDEWCAQVLKREIPLKQLQEHVAKYYRTRRLGEYFETLVHYWLAEVLRVPALYTNVQVQRAERTLGEFDFLFLDSAQATHWETAIKFYLYSDTHALFYGPAGNDRLDLKMKKIFEHQLPLSTQDEARPVFERLGLQNVISKAFVKGMLFYPRTLDWQSPPVTPGVSPHHARGWWAHYDERLLLQSDPDQRWRLLEKPDWISGGDTSTPGLTRAELMDVCKTHFATSKISLMVSELSASNNGQSLERSRGFIAHADWPFR